MLTKVFAKLGHECWNTLRAAGIFAVWRRVPITTVTITLVIGFWFYDYVSVSSAATASTPRPSVAIESAAPLAVQPLVESQPVVAVIDNDTPKKTRRTQHKKTAHSAFRRKRVGQDEVDYIANDVTIRLFTRGSGPTRTAHAERQRHRGKDLRARSSKPKTTREPKSGHDSVLTQAAERSALVLK